MTKSRTAWVGISNNPKKRPVQSSSPSPKQVAETILQELRDPGYIVSFYDEDVINIEQALKILAEAVLEKES